jgi:hypothetical protein
MGITASRPVPVSAKIDSISDLWFVFKFLNFINAHHGDMENTEFH